MPDREKLIKGLTAIEDEAYDRWVHQQYIEDPLITLIKENISDVLALLREQEPVKPKKALWIRPTYQDCHCSRCERQPEHEPGEGVPLYPYCPYCGAEMEVKWDA